MDPLITEILDLNKRPKGIPSKSGEIMTLIIFHKLFTETHRFFLSSCLFTRVRIIAIGYR